jgi:hypothetical protein
MKNLSITFLRCALLCLIGALAGCASVKNVLGIKPHTSLTEVRVEALSMANQDSSTTLDIVLIYDEQLPTQMPKTGPLWFDSKQQLTSNNRAKLDVVSFSIAPGKKSPVLMLDAKQRKAFAVYSYPYFFVPNGQNMVDLTLFGCAQITLTPNAVVYKSCS